MQDSPILAHFVDRIAHHPLAANAKNKLTYLPAREALERRYISPDLPYAVQWVKFDLDDPGRGDHTAVRWLDSGLQQPHFIVANRRDRGSHYLYGLKTPVDVSLTGRARPIMLFKTVATGMTRVLQADRRYTGVAVKNPLHRNWDVIVNDAPLFELKDLLYALPEDSRTPVKHADTLAEGRNTALFDALRSFAYSQAKAAKASGSLERWHDHLMREARSLNTFTPRLPASEVRSTVKSVANWTWTHAERLNGKPRTRAARFSWERDELQPGEAIARKSEGGRAGVVKTNAIRRSKTFTGITEAIAVLAGQGNLSPTVPQIALQAQLSERSVQRHRVYPAGTTDN